LISYRIRAIGWDVVDGPQDLVFPAACQLTIEFSPRDVFGGEAGPSPVVTDGGNLNVVRNQMTGAVSWRSDGRLPAVSVASDTDLGEFRLAGPAAQLGFVAQCPEDIWRRCSLIDVVLIPLFTLELNIPVLLERISGSVGRSRIEVRAEQPPMPLVVTSRETQEGKFDSALSYLHGLRQTAHPRMISALNYLHTAYRLRFAGSHPHEFLGEVVLNTAKALEALLTDSRDTWRTECQRLGFTDEEVEQRIVPIGVIRNELGVAHCTLATPDRESQRTIESFAGSSLEWATKVLQRALALELVGEYQPLRHTGHPWEQSHGRLISALRSYVSPP